MISTRNKSKIVKDTLKGLEMLEMSKKLNIKDPKFNFFRACDYALFGDKKGCLRTLEQVIDGGFLITHFL